MTDRPPADAPMILLVEDVESDAELVRIAMHERFPEAVLEHVTTGEAAIARVSCEPRISAVVLDLELPMTHGFVVLERVKRDQATRGIPVIIFTKAQQQDLEYVCQRLGARQYVIKPTSTVGYRAFATYLKTMLGEDSDPATA